MLNLARERLLASTIISGFAASFMAAGVAMAQDPAPTPAPEAAASGEEEVVVTGSRIKSANVFSTSPVTQVTAADVTTQGVTKVEDLVNQLPQAFAAQNSTVANGATGTATVSLRNLGSTRTLVLIDGKRMGYGSPLDAAADLNQIPGGLVERVDVLTGGASAVYGSDALAGVVNFIMKKDFEGVRVDAQYNFYQHSNDYESAGTTQLRDIIAARAATNPSQFQLPDDNVTVGHGREVTVMMGVNSEDGKGNLTAYFTYRKNDEILQRDYDYSACSLGTTAANIAALSNPGVFTCGGSGTSFPGQFTDFVNFAYTIGPNGTFVPYSTALNAYNFGPINHYQRPDERYAFGVNGHYEINEHVEVYTQLMFSDLNSVAQIAPSGIFFNTDASGLMFFNCDTPLLSAQQRTAIGCTPDMIAAGDPVEMYVGRRNVEGGGRQSDLTYTSYRVVGGARGEIGDGWSYDISAQRSHVRLEQIYKNDFSVTRILRALNVVNVNGVPTCVSVVDGSDANCVPLMGLFNGQGLSQANLDYLQIPLVQVGSTEENIVSAEVSGPIATSPWAQSPIEIALGLEYRYNALKSVTDTGFSTGDGAGQGGPTIGLEGSTDVYEFFMETRVPVIEGLPGAELLSFDAAFRLSDYNTGVQTTTWKVGGEYAPVEDIRLRASFQHAVRAPNVIDLFTADGFNLFDMDEDPCGPAQTATLAQCVATGVPANRYGTAGLDSPAGQYNFLQGGNANLRPEEADTFTIGFVATPTFVENLIIAVDYFDIDIENLISTTGAVNTIDACYFGGDATSCSRINRNSNGQLWVGSGYVEDKNTNIGGIKTSGVDVAVNYLFDIEGSGTLAFAMTGTWLDTLEIDPGLVTTPVIDCVGRFGPSCGTPSPKWRHRFRTTWSTPWDFDLNVTWRYYGSVDYESNAAAAMTRIDYHFKAENYFDLAANVYLPQDVTLRIGVNNVFDNDPPISASVGTTGNGNTYPQTYDSMGRYVFMGATVDF